MKTIQYDGFELEHFDSAYNFRKYLTKKKSILIIWVLMILFFSLNYNQSAKSFFRWKHPLTNFLAPKPLWRLVHEFAVLWVTFYTDPMPCWLLFQESDIILVTVSRI